MNKFLISQIQESLNLKQTILQDKGFLDALEQACSLSLEVYRSGGKLLIGGNGGSAAAAQHIAGELVSRS